MAAVQTGVVPDQAALVQQLARPHQWPESPRRPYSRSASEIEPASTTDVRGGRNEHSRNQPRRRGRSRHPRRHGAAHTSRRLSTETKAAFKTTEFFAYLAVLAGILIAGAVIDSSDAGGYGARQVWLYATILTVGYLLSRGLAKSGSRDPYDADDSDR